MMILYSYYNLKEVRKLKKVKTPKVEYMIMSQLVGLSIIGHGTKYKQNICKKDSKK